MIPEKHFGKVLKNKDPKKLGRLQIQVDAVLEGENLGDAETWIPASWPFAGKGEGFYMVPKEGSLVEVEVESGRERSAGETSARWTGVQYTDKDAIPEEFQSDPTERGGMKVGELVLLFDRKKGILALISAKTRLGEEDASHPLMRGDTFNAQLETYLTAEAAWVGALQTYLGTCQTCADANVTQYEALAAACTGPLVPLKVAFEALKAAWQAQSSGVTAATAAAGTYLSAVNAFKAAKDTWLSTKCKTE